MTASDVVQRAQAVPVRKSLRAGLFGLAITAVLGLLTALPWWTLVGAGTQWPAAVDLAGTVTSAAVVLGFPLLAYLGHVEPRHDWAARTSDAILGLLWVLFTWSVLGNVLRLGLAAAGVDDPARSRVVAAAVVSAAVPLLVWGYSEAMRVPRVRSVEVVIPRLGRGLDGVRIVALTDTHFGPIDRTRWSAGVVAAVNALEPDIVAHIGDIADGSAAQRLEQSAPLAAVQARLARVYVTGNHEYFSGDPDGWLDRMRQLGWQPLHDRHIIVERAGARLVVAGVDDLSASVTPQQQPPGHGLDEASAYGAALAGADPDLPILLLAHQPKQIDAAVRHGVDLQISGHTHGGQIWPFHYLVRIDQPTLCGLSRHGDQTQLYTSRGTGFWGPPLRIFAPSEITLLTLRSHC